MHFSPFSSVENCKFVKTRWKSINYELQPIKCNEIKPIYVIEEEEEYDSYISKSAYKAKKFKSQSTIIEANKQLSYFRVLQNK